jgi:hypothetical protein
MIRNNDERWINSIKELLPMVNMLHNIHPDRNINKFVDLVSHMIKHHGKRQTIEKLKRFRLLLQQYALQQTVEPIPFCKTDRDGFPKAISFIKPKLDDVYSIRYSFSVIRIIESFRCEPEYLVNTITDESTADENLIDEISSYIQTWSQIKKIPDLEPSRLVMSNKSGPNGPATINALKDLTALREEPMLIRSISEMMMKTSSFIDMNSYKSHEGSFKASKLVLLSDKACKTRVIAIADWWSNTALESIHASMMKALARLPSDVTYRQSDIPRLVKGLGTNLYSSDMTAFTDRFPRKLEVALLSAAYGEHTSRLWEQIVSNRKFHHPKGDVIYACGNPMGLLSSWPVSTMTHHAVKQWCSHKLGLKSYKYLILGDDTLDSSKEVYELYTDTIRRLGVSISLSKCTQSEQGSTEFAKRYFRNHEEVTGLPVHLLETARKMPEQLLELVKICRERGYEDKYLGPSMDLLLSNHKSGKMVADMLSLPEQVLGMPPLLEVKPNTWADKLSALQEESLKDNQAIARNYIFWKTTTGLNKSDIPEKVSQVAVEQNHPIVFALSEQLMEYFPETGDEFSIYNGWIRGEYREMAQVPNIDIYRCYNKGHYATKCKYDVLKAQLALANGDCNIPLHMPTKMSNFMLFNVGYQVLQEYLGP